MRGGTVIAATVLLAACGSGGETRADAERVAGLEQPASPSPGTERVAAPDLALCPRREQIEEGLRERSVPIAVPEALRDVMRSGFDNLAFNTRDGATLCVDASWMETIRNAALSPDRRFVEFDWIGYEAFGHVIVDRSGKGQVVDTGVLPAISPSGKLLAAADLGEAGFGALNAFAVWRIAPTGIVEVARQEDASFATDWRMEGWAGETCVDLSATPWEDGTGEVEARQPFRARESNGWHLEPGRCLFA